MGLSLGDPLRRTNDGRAYRFGLYWAHLGGEHELVQGDRAGTTLRHANRPTTACELILKKGPKRFRFDPLTALEIAPKTSDALASNVLAASVLTHRFGLLDRRIVIPGAANGDFAHARRSKLGRRLGLALATCADARATSGRELVDPCGSLIQTRIHRHLSLRRCALTHGAPDSFFIGY